MEEDSPVEPIGGVHVQVDVVCPPSSSLRLGANEGVGAPVPGCGEILPPQLPVHQCHPKLPPALLSIDGVSQPPGPLLDACLQVLAAATHCVQRQGSEKWGRIFLDKANSHGQFGPKTTYILSNSLHS